MTPPAPTRRAFLAGGGLALGAALAGCSGFSLASFAASPATVPAGTLRRTGYEERAVDEQILRQGFGPANRLVEVTNWVAQYERPLAPSIVDALPGTPERDQRVALFVALATPKVEVGGRQFNPVGGFSASDVLEQAQSVYGGLHEVERVDERELTVLGSATRVVEYRAAGGITGGGVSTDVEGVTDLTLHVTDPVEHGTDFVLGLAAHPSATRIERETVERLLRSVEHEEQG